MTGPTALHDGTGLIAGLRRGFLRSNLSAKADQHPFGSFANLHKFINPRPPCYKQTGQTGVALSRGAAAPSLLRSNVDHLRHLLLRVVRPVLVDWDNDISEITCLGNFIRSGLQKLIDRLMTWAERMSS